LGYAYSEKNDLEKAMELNRKALSYFPDSASLHNNLGNALVAKNKTQDALVEFNLACALDKGSHIYIYNKGIVEMNAGMTGDAENSFRRATRMKPGWEPPGKQLEILTSRHKANP
jgi:Tfp pilus assembly protein PilF